MTAPRLMLFEALPDDGVARIVPLSGGPDIVWPGHLHLNDALQARLPSDTIFHWHSEGRPVDLRRVGAVVNLCTDPERYGRAFAALEAAVALESGLRGRPVPVFNRSAELRKTTRDGIAARLQGIDGLRVPRCVRVAATELDRLPGRLAVLGLDYPLLVRTSRSHGGREMALLRGEADWAQVRALPLLGDDLFLTEFVDFAGESGDYTKVRIAMVGSHHLIRHTHFGEDWKVHRTTPTVEKVAREIRVLEALEADPRIAPIVAEVTRRIGLDYWGMDVGYRGPSRELVLFEANATMAMLFNPREKGDPARLDDPVAVKKRAVAKRLEAMVLERIGLLTRAGAGAALMGRPQ